MNALGAFEKLKHSLSERLGVFDFAFPHYKRSPTGSMKAFQLGRIAPEIA